MKPNVYNVTETQSW